jgi:hypothetical protein
MVLDPQFATEIEAGARYHPWSFDQGLFGDLGMAGATSGSPGMAFNVSPSVMVGWREPLGSPMRRGARLLMDAGVGARLTFAGSPDEISIPGVFVQWSGGFVL